MREHSRHVHNRRGYEAESYSIFVWIHGMNNVLYFRASERASMEQ